MGGLTHLALNVVLSLIGASILLVVGNVVFQLVRFPPLPPFLLLQTRHSTSQE